MSKRIFLKIAALCLIFAGVATWYYQAQKFDMLAKEELDIFFQQHSNYLSYGSAEIDKYTFKVTLKDVNIKPIAVKYDEIIVRHLPLFRATRLNFGKAHIVDTITQQELLYCINEGYVTWITRPLFDREKFNWTMTSSYDRIQYFNSTTNKKVHEATDGKSVLKHEEQANGIIALDSHNDYSFEQDDQEFGEILLQAGISISEKYGYKIPKQFHPQPQSDELTKLLNQMQSLSLPAKNKLNVHLEYDKELYGLTKKFIDSNFDESLANDFVKYLAKDFVVNISCHDQTKYFINTVNFDFTKKDLMAFKLDSSFQALNKGELGEKYVDVIHEFGVPAIQKYLPKFAVTKQEVQDLLSPLFQVDNMTVKMEVNELAKNHYQAVVSYNADNQELGIKGELLNDEISSQVTMSKPKVFIANTMDYWDQTVAPIFARLENVNYKTPPSFEGFKKATINFVDTFDKDGNTDEKLDMDITYNKKDLWKINQKDIDTLFKDPKSSEFAASFTEFKMQYSKNINQ